MEAPEKRVEHFLEFHRSLPMKEQKLQGARCMACGVPFCQAGMPVGQEVMGCPLHNLIPETNEMVYHGNTEQAYHRLSVTHGLPEFTSRVCPALCEQSCACGFHTDPVAVRENERAIIEYAFRHGLVEEKEPEIRTGKSVAIVGSGPAGLAAAQLLNRRGHKVTIFEKDEQPGGLLRYGIPNMKLDKRIIDRRVSIMEKAGIEFKCKTAVGTDVTAEELLARFDRVILCCGAAKPRDLTVPGREAKGVALAVDFLREVNTALIHADYDKERMLADRAFRYRNLKGKHVVIVGGGDTATDCVASAIRLGAASVKQLIRRPQPVKSEPEYGQEECMVVFGYDPRSYETAITECLVDNRGKLKAVLTAPTEPVADPVSGRVTWMPKEGKTTRLKADVLLIAAGFAGAEDAICREFSVETDHRSNVKTGAEAYETSADRVFAAGDVRRGQSLVVWAIAEGRAAAKAVDESLMGYTNL